LAPAPSPLAAPLPAVDASTSVWRQILTFVGWPEPSADVKLAASRRMSMRTQSNPPSASTPGVPVRRSSGVQRLFDMETGIFYDAKTLMAAPPRAVTEDLVFLCYNRAADEPFALSLAKHLKELGIPVWVDQWDIRGGRRWDEAIEEALNRCTHLLLV